MRAGAQQAGQYHYDYGRSLLPGRPRDDVAVAYGGHRRHRPVESRDLRAGAGVGAGHVRGNLRKPERERGWCVIGWGAFARACAVEDSDRVFPP